MEYAGICPPCCRTPGHRNRRLKRYNEPMINFILKRLALAVPTMIAVSFLVFIVARAAPAGPVEIMLGQHATAADIKRLEHEYGLDKPVFVQYVNYIWNIVAHGDFGKSFTRGGQPIAEMI